MRKEMTVNIDITAENDGSFLARVREYTGCWASGVSADAAVATLLEMLPDYLEAFHGMAGIEIQNVEEGENDDAGVHRALVLA